MTRFLLVPAAFVHSSVGLIVLVCGPPAGGETGGKALQSNSTFKLKKYPLLIIFTHFKASKYAMILQKKPKKTNWYLWLQKSPPWFCFLGMFNVLLQRLDSPTPEDGWRLPALLTGPSSPQAKLHPDPALFVARCLATACCFCKAVSSTSTGSTLLPLLSF